MDVDSGPSEPAGGGGGGENHPVASSSSEDIPMLLPRHKHEAICQKTAAWSKTIGLEAATWMLSIQLAGAFIQYGVKLRLLDYASISSPVSHYFQHVYRTVFATTPTEAQLRDLLCQVAQQLDERLEDSSTPHRGSPRMPHPSSAPSSTPPASSAPPAAPPATSDAPESWASVARRPARRKPLAYDDPLSGIVAFKQLPLPPNYQPPAGEKHTPVAIVKVMLQTFLDQKYHYLLEPDKAARIHRFDVSGDIRVTFRDRHHAKALMAAAPLACNNSPVHMWYYRPSDKKRKAMTAKKTEKYLENVKKNLTAYQANQEANPTTETAAAAAAATAADNNDATATTSANEARTDSSEDEAAAPPAAAAATTAAVAATTAAAIAAAATTSAVTTTNGASNRRGLNAEEEGEEAQSSKRSRVATTSTSTIPSELEGSADSANESTQMDQNDL